MENKYCKLKTKLQKGRKNATVEYVTLIHISVLVILLYNIVKCTIWWFSVLFTVISFLLFK